MAFVGEAHKDSTVLCSEACNAINKLIFSRDKESNMMTELLALSKQLVNFFESTIQVCIGAIQSDLNSIQCHAQVLRSDLSSLGCAVSTFKSHPSSQQQLDYNSSLCILIELCFRVTNITFSFCKEVELNHSHIFDNIATSIGPLFKGSFLLLKISSECIECVGPLNIPDKDHTLIINVLSSLYSVSQLMLTFDPSLVLLSWKALGKLVCLLKDHTHLFNGKSLSLCNVICGMCEAMVTKSGECVKSATDKGVYSKLLKTCRFFATMIVKVVKEYCDLHHELVEGLLKFLLELTRMLPPSLSSPLSLSSPQYPDIEANISVVIEPLLVSVANCEQFLDLLTHFTKESDTDASSSLYSHLVLLCLILKNFQKLDEYSRQFLLERTSSQCNKNTSCRLFDSIFHCVKACSVEFSMPVYVPGVVVGGHAPRHVTLYEHVLTQVCSVVAILSSDDFTTMEWFLLHSLLYTEDCYVSLLALDVWCFVARWGPSSLCYDHVMLLAKLLFTITNTTSTVALNVKILLRRLVAFTTLSQQKELLRHYHPEDPSNLLLWTCVVFSSLDSAIQSEVCNAVYTSSCKLVPSSPITCTYNSLQCLNALLAEPELKPHLPVTIPSTLISKLIRMLNGITLLNQQQKNSLHCLIACELLQLFCYLIPNLTPDQTEKLLDALRVICVQPLPVGVLVGVARILSRCGTLTTSDVLSPLSYCFKFLLSHTHSWLLRNETLEAFKRFAEQTPCMEILEECIPASLNNDVVVDFIQNVPHSSRNHPELLEHSNIQHLLIKAIADGHTTNDHTPTSISKDHTPMSASKDNAPVELENDDSLILIDDEEQEAKKDYTSSDVLELLLKQWEVVKTSSLTLAERKTLSSLSEDIALFLCNNNNR